MSDAKVVQAQRLAVGADNKVVDLDTGKPMPGIAVFGARPAAPVSSVSPFAAMRRWSAWRQSDEEPNG